MKIRWTPAAANDLEAIASYLFEKTPENAARLVRELYQTPLKLEAFPNLGRAGRKSGTRELILTALPYVIVYQIKMGAVDMLRVLHTSQNWPT
jgi:toxin ParE1/3/4